MKNFTLIDFDTIEESNLNRQILYKPKDIGKSKVETAKDSLLEYEPNLNITTINKEIKSYDDIQALKGFDIDFFICTADYPFHYIYSWVNKFCIENNIPWIQANSAEASGFVGPLVIPGKTSCYGCIEAKWVRNNPDYTFESDYLNAHKELYSEKSSTICPAIGMIGNFTALEIIKYITGFAKPITLNLQISLDFGTLEFDKTKFKRSKECKVCKNL